MKIELKHTIGIAGVAIIAGMVVAATVILTLLGHLHISFAAASKSEEATLEAKRRPVEFLYLDGGRVLTYLEEVQGGNITSEEQSQKLTKTLSAKLQVQGALEGGNSSQEEDLVQRAIAPTAASSYFELVNDLEAGDKITRISWPRYSDIENLTEGQFVQFTTHVMRPPIYIDPYLAVRQDATLAALFPKPTKRATAAQHAVGEQRAASRFAKQVGRNPRIVFSLREKTRNCPQGEQEGTAGPSAFPHPQSLERASQHLSCLRGKRHVSMQFLLPLRYRQLSDEGSLIQDGGGEITVFGKIVRIFRGNEHKKIPYIDSPTRQTWRRPLHQALGALICRSDPVCEKRVREEKNGGTAIGEAPRDARQEMEEALVTQTEIHHRGAVVVPVAIYK